MNLPKFCYSGRGNSDNFIDQAIRFLEFIALEQGV